jgi:hypothetical protein
LRDKRAFADAPGHLPLKQQAQRTKPAQAGWGRCGSRPFVARFSVLGYLSLLL